MAAAVTVVAVAAAAAATAAAMAVAVLVAAVAVVSAHLHLRHHRLSAALRRALLQMQSPARVTRRLLCCRRLSRFRLLSAGNRGVSGGGPRILITSRNSLGGRVACYCVQYVCVSVCLA